MNHESESVAGVPSFIDLSDEELLAKLRSAVQKERRVTLGVLFLLIEMERPKLHFDMIRLGILAEAHDQRAADIAFGRAFMDKHRSSPRAPGPKPLATPAAGLKPDPARI